MPTNASAPALGEEALPAGEAAAIEQILAVSRALLDTAAQPVPRQQHGKGHGVVRGEFRVSPDVPPELRHGVFREPRAYPALVRFSNGGERDESDKDAHGMAIKLFGVPGPKILEDERDAATQDFVLLDSPTFFIRDALEYARFAVALLGAVRWSRTGLRARLPKKLQKLALFAHLYWNYLRSHPYEKRLFLRIRKSPPASALAIEYWSTTPYRLGPHAVRWSVRPRFAAGTQPARHGAALADPALDEPENRLRAALVAHLAERPASFEFLAQRQSDALEMPVEDPTIAWSEERTPPVVLATLHIPQQTFDTPHRRALGEALSFTPWHAVPEHRPLGGINRARGQIYVALARRRRELNQMAMREPDEAWLTREWDGSGAAAPRRRAPDGYRPSQARGR
jgi:hypothetical protein